ncbi:MAG TPA: GNAT family N-acetyltransferase [Desulfobacteria bacterium]|nr:GNAT family N-acetyltransferase [Desulfobacteria bacterium]
MSSIKIRTSELEDLPALTEIYNEQVSTGIATFDTEVKSLAERREWFHFHQNPKYPLISALANDTVAGWGSLSPFHPRPAYDPSTEFSVYIHQNFRGQGIGEAIVRELLHRAGILGFHSVIGLITGENVASLELSKKLGFETVGKYREVGKKFDRWLDVVCVQYML